MEYINVTCSPTVALYVYVRLFQDLLLFFSILRVIHLFIYLFIYFYGVRLVILCHIKIDTHVDGTTCVNFNFIYLFIFLFICDLYDEALSNSGRYLDW